MQRVFYIIIANNSIQFIVYYEVLASEGIKDRKNKIERFIIIEKK
jgi:hypothetical protein